HSVVKETSGTIATTNLKVVFHEVVAGDNLSRLAEKYLGSHSKYLELYEANRDLLGSPDDLSPGMMLKIPQGATRAGVATNKSKVDISTPKTKGTTEASVDRQAKSAFVQPNPTSLITVGRTGRSGRSLSQTPPEDLPRVAGLEARSDATAIASRPKETSSSAGSNSSKAN
ncbi:MAG: LysM peptidoglycan-binding domain-containing protein, partial [Planctomycetota bacterium]|nr:LysM peptidoglycan-binding domain-containing protein [Planctomycetota bacterium]